MFILPTSEALLQHRLEHYTKRYNEEKDFWVRVWLRKELYLIKKQLEALWN